MEEIGINFSQYDIAVMEKLKKEIMNCITKKINYVIEYGSERNFSNTIQPLINMGISIDSKTNSFTIAKNFHPDKTIRDFGNQLEIEIEKFYKNSIMTDKLFNVINQYRNSKNYQNEKSKLSNEEIKYFDYMMRDFRRNGVGLENSDEIKNLLNETNELCSLFRKNMNECVAVVNLNISELDGLPDYWFKGKSADENNYCCTMAYPDIFGIFEYANNENTRKKIYSAFYLKCMDNLEILNKVIGLKSILAQKLGYKTWADYRNEINMTKNAQNALDFSNKMDKLFTPFYQTDIKNLIDFAKNYKLNKLIKDNLDPWDMMYYTRLYTEQQFDINLEQIKKYFPLDVVRNGIFTIYQQLLNLKIIEISTENKWHLDVKFYCVKDADTDEIMGYFYLDMYPREGKFGNAAVFTFVRGYDMTKINGQNKRMPHMVALVCNFAKDSCLTFREVTTFFHEFGHAMHQLCSKPQIYSFGGLDVETDFIEAPSQFLEYFVYTKTCLQILSKHCETGERIPLELIEKIKQKKNFLRSIFYKGQILYGQFDLHIHTMEPDTINDNINFQDIWYDIDKRIKGTEATLKLYPFCSFGHIISGYDAQYYSYMMADTYAANMFYAVFSDENDILNKEKGMLYRKKILEPGSTKDTMSILEDFLGGKPNESYFANDLKML